MKLDGEGVVVRKIGRAYRKWFFVKWLPSGQSGVSFGTQEIHLPTSLLGRKVQFKIEVLE